VTGASQRVSIASGGWTFVVDWGSEFRPGGVATGANWTGGLDTTPDVGRPLTGEMFTAVGSTAGNCRQSSPRNDVTAACIRAPPTGPIPASEKSVIGEESQLCENASIRVWRHQDKWGEWEA
jgi:hypothetical protein